MSENETAALDIKIQATGAAETLEAVRAGLQNASAAARANAAEVDANRLAYQKWREESVAGAAAQRALAQQGYSVQQAIALANATQSERVRILAQDRAATDAATAAATTQTEAMQAQVTAQETATRAFDTGALGLGRVRQGFASLAAQATGTLPVLDRLGSSLLTMAAGNVVVIGVLAGVALVGHAYESFTENARKAKEEQDALTESLRKWYERLSNGPAGERSTQVAADIKLLAEQQKQMDALQAKLASPTANRSESVEASLNAEVAALQKAMATERAEIAAGGKDITQTLIGSFNEQRDAQIAALAERLKFNADDESARQQALTVLKQDQALYAQYLKLPVSSENSALVAEYARQITQLNDALNPKTHVTTPGVIPETNTIVLGLQKQFDALQKVNEENNKNFAAGAARLALLHAEGEAREYLADQAKAEQETLQAYATLSGSALTDRLAGIAAEKQQSDELVRQKTAMQDAATAQKFLNDQVAVVSRIGADNAKAIQEQTEATARFTAENQRLSDSIENDLLRAIEQLSSRGLTSFRDFFQEGSKLALQFSHDFEQSIGRQQKLLDGAYKDNDADAIDKISGKIADLQKFAKEAQTAGALISAGVGGYNTGLQDGNSTRSAITGGISGAIQGGEAAGPWGAVAGGLIGAGAALFGAAENHKRAAEALQKAAEQVHLQLSQYNVAAGASPITANLEQNHAQANSLYDSIDAALPGLKNQIEREKEMAQVRKDEAAIAQKLATDLATGLTQQLNALHGAAGALANQLTGLDDTYLRNVASINALRDAGLITADQQATEAAQAKQLHDEAAAQAQKAYDEQRTQTQEDLAARLAVATGTSHQVDVMKQEIAWRRELAAASADDVDAIKAVQAAEKAKADADFARLNQQTQEDAQVRLLRATGHSDEADTLALQIQQQREYDAAVQQGLDAATLAALKLAEAAEQAQLAAQQAAAAMQKMVSGIKQDQSVLGLSNDETLAREAAALGFAGLTIDEIKAQYIAHDHKLTDDQEALDARISQYLQDYTSAHSGGAGSGVGQGNLSHVATSQVQNDITSLTEGTGSRMADFLSSTNTYARDSRDYLATIAAHFGNTDSTWGQYTPSSASLSASPGAFGGATTINVSVGPVYLNDGSQVPAAGSQLTALIAKQLNNQLKRDRLALSPSRT